MLPRDIDKMHSQFGNISLLRVGIARFTLVEVYVASSRKEENGRGAHSLGLLG